MNYSPETECAAFVGHQLIASGALAEVVNEIKRHHDQHPNDLILVFDNKKSSVIEIDLRGTLDEVFARLETPKPVVEAAPSPKRPGRPKLGVVSKEVTLLPRHWEWLRQQRGGASVTLRKLVGEAMRSTDDDKVRRLGQQRVYHLMTAVAGDLPNYEEATRALFAADESKFFEQISDWPEGLLSHLKALSVDAFAE